MSGGPGRQPEVEKTFVKRAYKRSELSSDAKIMAALRKKQPQTKEELCKVTGVQGSTFYRTVSLLQENEILKCVDGMYAFSDFDFLEKTIEDAFHELLSQRQFVLSAHLVQMTCKPWREIEAASFRVAKKLGLTPCQDGGEQAFLKTQ